MEFCGLWANSKENPRKRNALNALAMREKDKDVSLEINRLRGEINDLLNDKEFYWGQRAKAH